MMTFDGLSKTSGSRRERNWRTEPRKKPYDEFQFKAISHRVDSIDELISRLSMFEDRERMMGEGY